MSENTPQPPFVDELEQTSKIPLAATVPTTSNLTPHPGLVLATTYRLENLLGEGAMGQVWLAEHLILGEPRAIKFLSADYATDPEGRQRFIFSEAKNALRLLHPNIVRVYDIGQEQGLLYIIMEYIRGSAFGFDLKTVLKKKGRLSLQEAGEYLQQMAAALAEAHSHNLVHRDVKPANILVTHDNTLKLTDFGIVKDLSDASDLTSLGYVVGTPAYMAPEQVTGAAVAASDQYALGIMLYEWLAGHPPFQGRVSEILAQQTTALPQPLSALDPAIPDAVNAVVLKALAKLPQDRFGSVLELVAAYQMALHQSGEEADATISLTPPMPATSASKQPPPHNLPQTANRFIGRELEIAEIVKLVSEHPGRLVTLTGMGGTGKTRLALQVAENLLPSFRDGVFFMALENTTERSTFIGELAVTLGLQDQPGQTLLAVLKDWLAEKELLVVLDNFEQLVTNGATLVGELLKAAPHLKIVVTSRESLRLSAEREYAVAPLALPTKKPDDAETGLERMAGYGAVALFVERARAVRSDFNLTAENSSAVAEICRRLDGLPLALELAAARLKVLSPQKILERLSLKLLTSGSRDLPARQQTLRGAIDWGYDLLEPAEQVLFARLSIFAGGCTLEAAEAVCNAEFDLDIEVLDGVESLLQKSLLRQWDGEDGERYYGMLQTIREYALEKLAEQPEVETIRNRYWTYYLDLVETLTAQLSGANQVKAIQQLDSDYTNLRQVLRELIEAGESARAVQLGAGLGLYWHIRAYWTTGRLCLEQLLPFTAKDSLVRTKILNQLGNFYWYQGDYDHATQALEEALFSSRQLEDLPQLGAALVGMGKLEWSRGNYPLAHQHFEENLNLQRRLGNMPALANAVKYLGNVEMSLGNYAEAMNCYKESLKLMRELANELGIADALHTLGVVSVAQGDYAAGRQYYEESLVIKEKLHDKYGIAETSADLGSLLIEFGDYARGRQYLEKSLVLMREVGDKPNSAVVLRKIGLTFARQQLFEQAQFYYNQSLVLSRQINNNREITLNLKSLAELAALQQDYTQAHTLLNQTLGLVRELGEPLVVGNVLLAAAALFTRWGLEPGRSRLGLELAATLLGAALYWVEQTSHRLNSYDRQLIEENRQLLTQALGQTLYAANFARGQQLSLTEAATAALEFELYSS